MRWVLGPVFAVAVIGAAPAALAENPDAGSSTSMTIAVTILPPDPGSTPPPAVPATTTLIPFQPAELPPAPVAESQESSLPASPGVIAAVAMVGFGVLGGAVRLVGHVAQVGMAGLVGR